MERVSAEAKDLMRQAGYTADTYLSAAIERIDQRLGKGYSKKNPALIEAFMRTCAQDFNTAAFVSVLQDLDEHLCQAVRQALEERGES